MTMEAGRNLGRFTRLRPRTPMEAVDCTPYTEPKGRMLESYRAHHKSISYTHLPSLPNGS